MNVNMKRLKRPFITALIIVICFLIESTVFQAVSFGAISPNLLIVITAAFGVMRGKKEGMLVGFFSGLLFDVFFGEWVGLYALIYMVLGYVNGFFKQIFYPEDIKLPLILISISDFVYGNMICLLMFIMRSKFDYSYYLMNIIRHNRTFIGFSTLLMDV